MPSTRLAPVLRVVITRPAREAAAWVDSLQAAGIAALALPLMAIGEAPDVRALARAWHALGSQRAVMFVSANAVRGFWSALPAPPAWPQDVRAWATGPGTRAALVAAGVPPLCVDSPPEAAGRYDSEALWDQVSHQVSSGGAVLIVRGADAQGETSGRDWLALRLQAHGVQVSEVAAYARAIPVWGPDERAQLTQALQAQAWWFFSSSEAVGNLRQLLPGHDWGQARALCTHDRIAAAARAAGFGRVAEAAVGPEALAAFLQSQA